MGVQTGSRLGRGGGVNRLFPSGVRLDDLFSYRAGDRPAGSLFSAGGPRLYTYDTEVTDLDASAGSFFRVDGANGILAFVGDSITAGSGSGSFADKAYRQLSGKKVHFCNAGVGSARLFSGTPAYDMISIHSSGVAPYYTALPGVIVVFGGTNDIKLDGVSAATAYSRLTTLCAAVRVSHPLARVVVPTMLPRENGQLNEATRSTFNASVLAGHSSYDAVADLRSDADLETSGNATIYPDTIHPSDLGYEKINAILAPIINAQLTLAGL